MSKQKRHYSAEFKQQALKLVETTDKTVSAIERELGITQGLLAKWKQRHKQRSEQFGRTDPTEQQAVEKELAHLRRENARLLQEREILKKAVAIFSNPKA